MSRLIVSLTAAILLCAAGLVQAATNTWVGAGTAPTNMFWSDATNWNPAGPISGNDVVVNTNGTYVDENFTIRSLTMTIPAYALWTMYQTNSAALTVTGQVNAIKANMGTTTWLYFNMPITFSESATLWGNAYKGGFGFYKTVSSTNPLTLTGSQNNYFALYGTAEFDVPRINLSTARILIYVGQSAGLKAPLYCTGTTYLYFQSQSASLTRLTNDFHVLSGGLTIQRDKYFGGTAIAGNLNLYSNATLSFDNDALNDNERWEITGAISGTGSVAVMNSGTAVNYWGRPMLFSNTNTFSGAITLGSGKVSVTNGAAIPDASPLTLALLNIYSSYKPTILDLAQSETIGSLHCSASSNCFVDLNTFTLTFGGNASNSYCLAPIRGTGSVVKVGAGTNVLCATNSYLGFTAVSNGVLLVHGTLGSTNTTVDGGYFGAGTNGFAGALAVTNGGVTVNTGGLFTYISGAATNNCGAIDIKGPLRFNGGTVKAVTLPGVSAIGPSYCLAVADSIVGLPADVEGAGFESYTAKVVADGSGRQLLYVMKPAAGVMMLVR